MQMIQKKKFNIYAKQQFHEKSKNYQVVRMEIINAIRPIEIINEMADVIKFT